MWIRKELKLEEKQWLVAVTGDLAPFRSPTFDSSCRGRFHHHHQVRVRPPRRRTAVEAERKSTRPYGTGKGRDKGEEEVYGLGLGQPGWTARDRANEEVFVTSGTAFLAFLPAPSIAESHMSRAYTATAANAGLGSGLAQAKDAANCAVSMLDAGGAAFWETSLCACVRECVCVCLCAYA